MTWRTRDKFSLHCRKLPWLVLILFGLTLTKEITARPPDESEFLAASLVSQDIANWVLGQEKVPRSVGIFSVYANYPFDQDYATIVETEVLKTMAASGLEKVTSCSECRAPQISVQDERIVIRKGAPDLEALKKLGAKEPVDAFLTIDIYRTKLSVVFQAVLYQNPSGAVIAAERFKVPSINMMDAAVQVLLEFGGGKPVGGTTASSTFITAGNLLLLEDVGFAKAGLNLGADIGLDDGSLIYLNPTLGFYGRYGRSAIGWAFDVGAGFGMMGGGKGISLRGAYEIFLGSLAVTGFEFTYYLPQSGGASNSGAGYAGIHIGLALGR